MYLKSSRSRRRRTWVWWLFALMSIVAAAGSTMAVRLGYVERLRVRLYGQAPRLSPGDFPAGVMAPVDEVVKIPLRPLVIGVVANGSVAPLLWAAGDKEHAGLFRSAYAIDVKIDRFNRDDELRKALVRGAENGGVDFAALPVSSVAMSASLLHDASPRVIMLLGRSRGQEAVVGKSITSLQQLAGKRISVEERSSAWYLLLWSLSRVGLSLRDVTLTSLGSSFEAAAALRSKDVDVVAGYWGEIEPAAAELGARKLSSTADAPHLTATVLISRGDFAARYPDAIRRVIRGVLDANTQTLKDRTEAAKVLGAVAPQLGDPMEAIAAAPPASLGDNLAFFGIADEAPVTYAELFESAAALNRKLFEAPAAPHAEDTLDLGPLKYVSNAGRP